MDKKTKVLFVAAECKPYASAGGVGVVAGEFPPYLNAHDIDVTVVVPGYQLIDPKHFSENGKDYHIGFAGERNKIEVRKGNLGSAKIIFLLNPDYFKNEVYTDSFPVPFLDDGIKFSFFAEACLEIIGRENPDIVHGNDWLSGYLFGRMTMEGMKQKKAMTIHNGCYQGNINFDSMRGLDMERILLDPNVGPLFADHRPGWGANPQKLALGLTNIANAVSPTYAEELTIEENSDAFFAGGSGLHATYRRMKKEGRLLGILNGFNYSVPEPDYGDLERKIAEKRESKKSVSKYFKNPKRMLLGFVGRAVEQKFRLLAEQHRGKSVLEHILDMDVNVAILGTGDPQYESFAANITMKDFAGLQNYASALRNGRRDNYFSMIAFDKDMARRISLASDLFLMPSIFEPCGITQLEAMNDATLPLARSTGGLADTIIPHSQSDGNGFLFDARTRDELLENLIHSIQEAREIFLGKPEKLKVMQANAFRQRFLWSDSAKEYAEKMYQPLMNR